VERFVSYENSSPQGLALVGYDVFLLLHPVEERKVEMVDFSLLKSLLGVICQSP